MVTQYISQVCRSRYKHFLCTNYSFGVDYWTCFMGQLHFVGYYMSFHVTKLLIQKPSKYIINAICSKSYYSVLYHNVSVSCKILKNVCLIFIKEICNNIKMSYVPGWCPLVLTLWPFVLSSRLWWYGNNTRQNTNKGHGQGKTKYWKWKNWNTIHNLLILHCVSAFLVCAGQLTSSWWLQMSWQ